MANRKHATLRDAQARNVLVEQWSGLPLHVAQKFCRSSPVARRMGIDEAVQVAFMGLLRAAELWDPTRLVKGKPVQFNTYAFRACWQAIWSATYRFKHRNPLGKAVSLPQKDWGNESKVQVPSYRPSAAFMLKDDVWRAFALLPKRHQLVVWGTVVEERTLREVSRQIHLSWERVRQLKEDGLAWMHRFINGRCPPPLVDNPQKKRLALPQVADNTAGEVSPDRQAS